MVVFRIKRVDLDVVLTASENGVDQTVRFPERLLHEIIDETGGIPDAREYPIGISVGTDRVEISYEDLLRLRAGLQLN